MVTCDTEALTAASLNPIHPTALPLSASSSLNSAMLEPLIGGGLSEPAAKNDPEGQKDKAESIPAIRIVVRCTSSWPTRANVDASTFKPISAFTGRCCEYTSTFSRCLKVKYFDGRIKATVQSAHMLGMRSVARPDEIQTDFCPVRLNARLCGAICRSRWSTILYDALSCSI